jgi:hypothetical protein
MGLFQNIFGAGERKPLSSDPRGDGWSARMGWRFVTYLEASNSLPMTIEPMAVGPDIVYVPDAEAWAEKSPAWAQSRRTEILQRLKSVAWARNLSWMESSDSGFQKSDEPVPGSLESTPGGRQLEAMRLFHPGSELAHAQSHELWHVAARRFAEAARGRVTLFVDGSEPDTVFQKVELPALKANPNVTLDFRKVAKGV